MRHKHRSAEMNIEGAVTLGEEIRACCTEEVALERLLNNEKAFFGYNLIVY